MTKSHLMRATPSRTISATAWSTTSLPASRVRKLADRVRITGQLIDAATGAHVWAERYDRKSDDIFALQDEITLSVVGAIEPSLRLAEIERVKRKRPDSLDAYDLLLQAQPDVYSGMPDRVTQALPLLERA